MNNLPVSAKDFIGAIAKTTQRLGADSTGMQYLKLSKGGFWIYGIDDIDVEEGSKWAINPNSLATGYVAWPINGTGKPLGEEMRGITDDPIIESQLPSVGDNAAWNQQVGMQLMCISGEDVGVEVVFKASSKGGLSGFSTMLNAVMQHFKDNANTDLVVPVIDLLVDDYKHPTYGKIYTPIFEILDWIKIDSMPAPDAPDEQEPEPDETPEPDPEPEPEEEAPPKKKRARAGKKPEGDEKAPRRRRRRAS